MAKRIKLSKTKNSCNYYIIDDYTHPSTKKRSTFIVEKLGNIEALKSRFDADSDDEALARLKEYVDELKARDKKEAETVSVTLCPNRLIDMDSQRLFNIGYLYPRSILLSVTLIDKEKLKNNQIKCKRHYK